MRRASTSRPRAARRDADRYRKRGLDRTAGRMLAFLRGEADVLVATSIIESGIDIPQANTLIVERSDVFGLGAILCEILTGLPPYTGSSGKEIYRRAAQADLGEALVRRLLTDRRESHVLLSTPEINGESNRAWRLYRRLGFADIIRGYHFAGDPRPFAILGRTLPL